MNFQGLIDFNKYTLALAAGGFVFTLEKFVPATGSVARWSVLALLVLFLASTLIGVAIFALCTKALHGDDVTKAAAKKRLPAMGTWHAALLAVSLVGLGVMLVPRVLAAPEPPTPVVVNCLPAPAGPPN
jgi:hypothetical protein